MQAIPTVDHAQAPLNPEQFDLTAARREGWTVTNLFVDGNEEGVSRQLGCFKSPEQAAAIFPTDREAWLHVVEQARAGSALHRTALRLVDPIERLAIENVCGCW